MLQCPDHSSRAIGYRMRFPVAISTPASQKTLYFGVCRSYQIVLPSALKNSWPAISISIVRSCISRRLEPSVLIVQMRSTSCQGPSWQYRIRVESVGDICTWFSQSFDRCTIVISPVLTLSVYSAIGSSAAQRASRLDAVGGGGGGGVDGGGG